ncbi:hypothetical protein ACFFQF_17305 [Haladaptatus pallidirubidus]|uniref:hypothetical protein n=1 Tax=Haladaptatus pallidirubidus TaxID=1008152 RepID=UPI001D12474A|nr:hypothetical protein [Haladaptatus pallidirubidus]
MFEYITITTVLVETTMNPSENGTTDNTSNQQEARSRNDTQSNEVFSVERTVRALLGVEAASFFSAALVHAGILIQGYDHQEAMIAESVIGTVLLVGLAMTWVRSRSMFSIAAGVQVFALLGTFIGIWTIIVGIGPRTIPDIIYHVVIVFVLAFGLLLTWRSR